MNSFKSIFIGLFTAIPFLLACKDFYKALIINEFTLMSLLTALVFSFGVNYLIYQVTYGLIGFILYKLLKIFLLLVNKVAPGLFLFFTSLKERFDIFIFKHPEIDRICSYIIAFIILILELIKFVFYIFISIVMIGGIIYGIFNLFNVL